MHSFAVICIIAMTMYFMILQRMCAAESRTSAFVGCKDKKENFTNALVDMKLRSNLECTNMCLHTEGCRSTSFRRNEKTCRMYTETMADRNDCETLAEESGTIVSFMLSQCVHGGTWDSENQKCTPCDYGFAGQYCERHLIDCHEGMLNGYGGEGEVLIQPVGYPQPFLVQCGYQFGRTELLHRGIRFKCNEAYEDFNRTWDEYREGFGTPNCEYFVGLEKLHFLTAQRDCILTVTVYSGTSSTQARYVSLLIADEENNFTMSYQSYGQHNNKPAGDGFGLGAPDASARNSPFCTPDRDCGSCAKMSHAGWWYGINCSSVNVHAPIDDARAFLWPLNATNDTLIERDSIRISVVVKG